MSALKRLAGGVPPERFSDAADVVRRGAAAHAEVRHTDVSGSRRERRQLVAVARERVERSRERAPVRDQVAAGIGE